MLPPAPINYHQLSQIRIEALSLCGTEALSPHSYSQYEFTYCFQSSLAHSHTTEFVQMCGILIWKIVLLHNFHH